MQKQLPDQNMEFYWCKLDYKKKKLHISLRAFKRPADALVLALIDAY